MHPENPDLSSLVKSRSHSVALIVSFTRSAITEIAFVGGNPNSSAVQERVEGYQRALSRSVLQFDPLLVIASAPTRRGGYDSVRKLLQIEDRPTAALCFNDVVALAVIEGIQLAGLKVGSDFEFLENSCRKHAKKDHRRQLENEPHAS
jgi:LacI family transcriptional regulator